VRKNDTTDYLISTLASSVNERIFTHANLNIPVIAGDFIEIKGVQPKWAVNPKNTVYGGFLYIEI
jgi:hypothetical protein